LSIEGSTNAISLEIILDKIHCVEERGIDWGGSDEIYARIDIDDGKHPLKQVRAPDVLNVAYRGYYSMDTGETIEINQSIYKVDEVGPYIQINVVALDDEWSDSLARARAHLPTLPEREDEVIGSSQIRFSKSEDWGRGTQHRVRCGGSSACVDLYFTIK
jgi:hypothetical protein